MTEIGTIDVGYGSAESATSISRFNYRRVDLGTITAADASTAQGAVFDFYSHLVSLYPTDVVLLFPHLFPVHDEATGVLLRDISTSGAEAVVTGTSGAPWAKGQGIHLRFDTANIVRGRHVIGGTFLVPLTADAFSVVGGRSGAADAAINTAAPLLMSDMTAGGVELVVWSKPLPHATHVRAVGFSSAVTSYTIGGVTALASRRA